MLTLEQAREYFHYDPETGKLYWKKNKKPRGRVGQEVGVILQASSTRSYRYISFDGRRYYAHRVIWFLTYGHWPIHEIDHLNGNGLDNHLSNLRDVLHPINQQNQKMRIINISGITGVSWGKRDKKWRACISVNRQYISLGYFNTCEAAAKARKEAEVKYGFTPRHGKKLETQVA